MLGIEKPSPVLPLVGLSVLQCLVALCDRRTRGGRRARWRGVFDKLSPESLKCHLEMFREGGEAEHVTSRASIERLNVKNSPAGPLLNSSFRRSSCDSERAVEAGMSLLRVNVM